MKNTLPPWVIVSTLIGFVSWVVWGRLIAAPITQARERMRKELAEAKELHDARLRVQRLMDEMRAAREHVAPTADADWLVNQLTSRVQEMGLRIESIVPHAPTGLQDFQQVSVTVQLAAGYHQLGQLLSQLEGADRLIWVQELDVARPREQAAWGAMEATRARASASPLPRVRLTVASLSVPEEIQWPKGRTGASEALSGVR